jgi:hypothetical protein
MAPVPLTMGAPDADSQGATYSSWVSIAPEGGQHPTSAWECWPPWPPSKKSNE